MIRQRRHKSDLFNIIHEGETIKKRFPAVLRMHEHLGRIQQEIHFQGTHV